MTEREYDRIHNGGGEGYNPIREARERKELEAHKEWLKTRAGRKDSIYRELERKDCSIARECGTYNQAEIDALRAELAAIEAEEEAEFVAAWPLDTTKTRRAEWNDRVKRGEITARNYIEAERKQGWTLSNLKRAVKYYNL